MAHTKGEWKVTQDRFVAVDEKELICEVYDRTNFIPVNGNIVPDEETGESNIKLICASPDLKKYGQYVIDAWEDYVQSGRKDFVEDMIGKLKATIKKTE